MMMCEFTERTGYEPSNEEYSLIEESYYNYDGNKDEFCKQWLKDKRNGYWDKEMALLKKIADLEAELKQSKAKELEASKLMVETDMRANKWEAKAKEAESKAEELEQEVQDAKAETEFVKTALQTEVTYKVKGKEEWSGRVEKVVYIDNGIQFVNIIEPSGWTTSIKIADLEKLEIR